MGYEYFSAVRHVPSLFRTIYDLIIVSAQFVFLQQGFFVCLSLSPEKIQRECNICSYLQILQEPFMFVVVRLQYFTYLYVNYIIWDPGGNVGCIQREQKKEVQGKGRETALSSHQTQIQTTDHSAQLKSIHKCNKEKDILETPLNYSNKPISNLPVPL